MQTLTNNLGVTASLSSNGSSGWIEGGPRNMKSMRLHLVAIFFMTYFHRAWGAMAPSAPLDPLLLR